MRLRLPARWPSRRKPIKYSDTFLTHVPAGSPPKLPPAFFILILLLRFHSQAKLCDQRFASNSSSLAPPSNTFQISTIQQYAVRAFSDALDQIPTALADNSGLNPIEIVSDLKAMQKQQNLPYLGVDCMSTVIFFPPSFVSFAPSFSFPC